MKKYYDVETETIVTIDELHAEFNAKTEEEKAEYGFNFNAWLVNCLDSTLERI